MFESGYEIRIGVDGFDPDKKTGVCLDLLGRKTSGQQLSGLVDRLQAPTVIALDGPWGSGKSHFLQLWCGAHVNENEGKAWPIYFDAFAHDYMDDPLLGLVAAIAAKDEAQAPMVQRLKRFAVPLLRTSVRVAAAAATAGISEALGAVGDAAVGALNDAANDQMDRFWEQEKGRAAALQGFREALKALAAEQKIILVVDELDRCRPDFALSLLEVTKHVFNVPNVHFVLGVNLEALEHSVRKRYGAGVDASLYLQKFFQLRMRLPNSVDGREDHWVKLFGHRCAALGVNTNVVAKQASVLIEIVSRQRHVSLRAIERITARLSLLPARYFDFGAQERMVIVATIILEALSAPAYLTLRSGLLDFASICREFGWSPDSAPELNYEKQLWTWFDYLIRTEAGEEPEGPLQESGAFRIFQTYGRSNALSEVLDAFTLPPS